MHVLTILFHRLFQLPKTSAYAKLAITETALALEPVPVRFALLVAIVLVATLTCLFLVLPILLAMRVPFNFLTANAFLVLRWKKMNASCAPLGHFV